MRIANRSAFSALVLTPILALGGLAACERGPEAGSELVRIDGTAAAMVNDDPIFFSDVELEAAAQGLIAPGDPFGPEHEAYDTILDQLIDQRLLAQEAVRRKLDQGVDARRRLQVGRERLLGNILVEGLVASEVNEDAIREMYSEQVKLQQLDDQVRIRHILVEDKATADTVIAALNGGGDFSALAFEYSQDKATRLEGGELGFISPNNLNDPWPAIIGNTSIGDHSEAFQSDDGWHVLKVEERRQTPPKTLEEMRPEIVTFLTYTEISKILRQLRTTGNVSKRRGAAPGAANDPASPPPPVTGADETTDAPGADPVPPTLPDDTESTPL